MHELSIVQALLEQVQRHLPPGSVLRRLQLRAGPMRAIEPQALQWAWQAATRQSPYEGAKLDLELLPWQLTCSACGKQWNSADLFEPCSCGADACHPVGGNDLQLLSLDYDDAPADQPTNGSTD